MDTIIILGLALYVVCVIALMHRLCVRTWKIAVKAERDNIVKYLREHALRARDQRLGLTISEASTDDGAECYRMHLAVETILQEMAAKIDAAK